MCVAQNSDGTTAPIGGSTLQIAPHRCENCTCVVLDRVNTFVCEPISCGAPLLDCSVDVVYSCCEECQGRCTSEGVEYSSGEMIPGLGDECSTCRCLKGKVAIVRWALINKSGLIARVYLIVSVYFWTISAWPNDMLWKMYVINSNRVVKNWVVLNLYIITWTFRNERLTFNPSSLIPSLFFNSIIPEYCYKYSS